MDSKILFLIIMGMIAASACTGNGSGGIKVPATPERPVAELINRQAGTKSFGDYYISGIVKSNVGYPITVWISVNLYDRSGVKLGDGYDIEKVDPYGQTKFEAVVLNSENYIREINSVKCYIDRVY